MPSIRTQKTSISSETKKKVHERDIGCCVVCGKPMPWNMANAHIVPRSSGGLGIEENIVTLCQGCHYTYDFGKDRQLLYDYLVKYLQGFYPDWERDKMIFRKGNQ